MLHVFGQYRAATGFPIVPALAVTFAIGLISSHPVRAQSLATKILESPAYPVRYGDDTLANGLRVLIVESHFAPVISAELFVRAGMRDQVPRPAIAHLLEHLSGDTLSDYPLRAGVAFNASTGSQVTDYFFTAPAANFEPALYYLAAILRPPLLDSARLSREKNVVIAEGGQRASNRAYGMSESCLGQLYWNAQLNCTGPDDWDRETLATGAEELTAFFHSHYRPNNATLVVVGDVATADALAHIGRYFGDIPRAPAPSLPASQTASPATKRIVLTDSLAPASRLDIAYSTVAGGAPEYAALNVLATILARGESSLLKRRLVDERQLATHIEVSGLDLRASSDPVPFIITAVLKPGVDPETAERAIGEEIVRLAVNTVPRADLERAKSVLAREFLAVTRGGGSRGLAYSLGFYATVNGNPELINSWLRAVDAVTQNDLSNIVTRLFNSPPRAIVTTLPARDSAGVRRRP
ncbi:MAG: insulinase family protein [Gemmatimonadota bacterium]|nr:insulinase family protein [Gemmatimonadota bacterium]